MPPRASQLLQQWETEALPESGKKGKKLKKKEKMALEKARAAAAAAEAERLRLQMIKDMHEEIRMERINAEKEAIFDEERAKMRREQLQKSLMKIFKNNKAFKEYSKEDREKQDWDQYMTCDGLPNPKTLSDLNTYLFLWSLEDEEPDMKDVTKKCKEVVYLLEKLQNVIDFLAAESPQKGEEFKKIRQTFRDTLESCLDMAAFSLLRRIERNMVREDLKNARYIEQTHEMTCCVWALIRLPISVKQIAEKDRKPVEVTFEELKLTVKMPLDIDCYCMAIRGMWVMFDHYSDRAMSFYKPKIPSEYQMNMAFSNLDILSYCEEEYQTKLRIKEDQVEGRRLRLEEKKAILEKLENPPSMTASKADKKAKGKKEKKKTEPEPEPEPLPYLPTPDEIILLREDEVRKEVRKLLFTRCEKTEINLRKYMILGGVFRIDLVYQPPQPKDMRRNIFLTTLQIPKELKYVLFSKPYKAPPPAPDSERTPEVIEAELKALEAAMEALTLVTLKLPDFVLWFEPPLVAHWVPERKIWSTQDVHDIKYNEEKQILSFRTGRLGPHGLAGFKFVNLPFQSWELKPEDKKFGGVILTIVAAVVQADFIVREDTVCLHSLTGGTPTALQDVIGQSMRLPFLIRKMRECGCDLFPEQDAHSYVKGLPIKHPVAEKHLQTCIGLLCTTFMFAWSRWNVTRSPREIIIQMRELHGIVPNDQPNLIIMASPLQTVALECTEFSPEFSDKPMELMGKKFYGDLYHLAKNNSGIKSHTLMRKVPFKLATTVTKLLESTNVISMSS
ncbi:axonemal 84 kDa protein [Orussus abietinus]|uniref:axonemal 84 kDa protein n=1 Tax=Orussus abietinus TaxID=222816 RepID=UPI0006266D01|nr:axonemal 84 kDa protein [Orussus abietinus]